MTKKLCCLLVILLTKGCYSLQENVSKVEDILSSKEPKKVSTPNEFTPSVNVTAPNKFSDFIKTSATEQMSESQEIAVSEKIPALTKFPDFKEYSATEKILESQEIAAPEKFPAVKKVSSQNEGLKRGETPVYQEILISEEVQATEEVPTSEFPEIKHEQTNKDREATHSPPSEETLAHEESTPSKEIKSTKKIPAGQETKKPEMISAQQTPDNAEWPKHVQETNNVSLFKEMLSTKAQVSEEILVSEKITSLQEIPEIEKVTTKTVPTTKHLTTITLQEDTTPVQPEHPTSACSINTQWLWQCLPSERTYKSYFTCVVRCNSRIRKLKKKEEKPSICKVPRNPIGILNGRTPCRNPTYAWSFYPDTERCESVPGGGCTMLSYVFHTEEECLAACVWGYKKTSSITKRQKPEITEHHSLNDLIRPKHNLKMINNPSKGEKVF